MIYEDWKMFVTFTKQTIRDADKNIVSGLEQDAGTSHPFLSCPTSCRLSSRLPTAALAVAMHNPTTNPATRSPT